MSGAESEPPAGATSGSSAAVPPAPAPPPQQQQFTAAQFSDTIRELIKQQQEITAAHLSDAIREIIKQQQQQQQGITAAARSRSEELRGWLMLVATLTASITFSAALNPPGGFWQADDADGMYLVGTPVRSVVYPRRYRAFYYSNFTSFMTSLCIIALSSTPALYNRIQRSLLSNLVTLDLVGLAVAFGAGSWTHVPELIYGSALLAVGVLCFVCFKISLSPRHLDIDQSV